MKTAWLSGVVFAAVLAAGAANAAVLVMGNGPARACYISAVQNNGNGDALRDCNEAISEQPLNRANRSATYVNRGIVHLNRNENVMALADFDRAIQLTPSLAEAYINRGAGLMAQGDYSGAVSAINQGLALQPAEPHKAYFIRATAYEELGDTSAAYRDYRQAAALAPEWEPARLELTRFSVR